MQPSPFALELGGELPQLEMAYHLHGVSEAYGSNVIWVRHPFTADSDPPTS